MAMKDFAREILLESSGLTPSERIAKTQKLVQSSTGIKEFIRQYLPELYDEAFPPSGSGEDASMESHPPHELVAKRH